MCKHCAGSTSFARWDAKDTFILKFEKRRDIVLSGDKAMDISAGPLGSGRKVITYIIGDWKAEYLPLRITG